MLSTSRLRMVANPACPRSSSRIALIRCPTGLAASQWANLRRPQYDRIATAESRTKSRVRKSGWALPCKSCSMAAARVRLSMKGCPHTSFQGSRIGGAWLMDDHPASR